MGTNYYVPTDKCKECGRSDGDIHIGKSSYGWEFCFQANGWSYYNDIDEMREWLKDKKIVDEYGEEISYDDFWKMVEIKQREIDPLTEEDKKYYTFINGYRFMDMHFS